MKEKYDKAKQLIIEAVTLYKTNAPESMRSALLKFEQARLIYQALNEQKEEAHCLGWLGSLSNSLGDKQKALDYYLQALPLYRAVDDKDGELGMLDRMSIIFHILGASRDAAVTHNKIGEVYLALGKNEQALKNYNQSLQLYRAANDNVGEANTLHNIGEVYSYLVGDREQALKFYKEALPLRYGFGDKELVADTLYNISAVYDDLGEQQLALKFYKEALPLFRVNNKTYEARTLYNLFSVLVLDNPRLGIFYGKLAVNIYQILPPWWQEHDKNVQQFFSNLSKILTSALLTLLANNNATPKRSRFSIFTGANKSPRLPSPSAKPN